MSATASRTGAASETRRGWRPGAGSAFAALALTVALGALLGAWLGDRMSEPGTTELRLENPGGVVGEDAALRSAGGFSGFGGLPALPGAALTSGAVVASEPGLVTIEADGSTIELRYTSTDRLFAIVPLDREPAAGDLIVVATSDDGSASGVLVVPADVEEGVGGAR